ncbi:hypothetical protein PoB_004423100 [Plakobranchus ocellatus]|uniref:Uncharacterized protein n=1 Tax=Plakobranchus ocellatus TaxID=259542 RepID=A0AAV4B2Y8_9GAST|nr:hypothetical protein PoB_004423100 [Plakobranchus ocellatus]
MAAEPSIAFLETFGTSCDRLDVSMDNSEMFMTEGIMNPKELYLIEDDSANAKDGTSSSDSGISALDDFQDIANVTDLNSLLDGELKDLDFGIDFSLHKVEQDDVFEPGVLVKQEPCSPSSDSSPYTGSDYGLETPCLQVSRLGAEYGTAVRVVSISGKMMLMCLVPCVRSVQMRCN